MAKKKTTTSTRKKTTKTKKPASVSSPAKPVAAPAEEVKETMVVLSSMPSIRSLLVHSGKMIWQHRVLFAKIGLVYGLISFLFQGQGLFSVNNLSGVAKGSLGDALGSLGGGSGAVAGAAGSTLQFFWVILAGLAIIWVLRQTHAGHPVTAKLAYYKSGTAFVPYLIVLLVIALQCLPLLIGLSLYEVLVAYGIVHAGVEQTITTIIAVLLALPTLYLLTSSLFATYIITLPETAPLAALRSARELVYKRRLKIFARLVLLPILMLIGVVILLAPFVLLIPALTQAAYFVVAALALIFLHTYMYELYRGLLDE